MIGTFAGRRDDTTKGDIGLFGISENIVMRLRGERGFR
jgi:hypothetical protein